MSIQGQIKCPWTLLYTHTLKTLSSVLGTLPTISNCETNYITLYVDNKPSMQCVVQQEIMSSGSNIIIFQNATVKNIINLWCIQCCSFNNVKCSAFFTHNYFYFQIVERVRNAFNSGKTKSYEFRKHQLEQLLKMYEENGSDIVAALSADLHKVSFFTQSKE